MSCEYRTNSCSVIGFKTQHSLRKQTKRDSMFVSEPLTQLFRILSKNKGSIG